MTGSHPRRTVAAVGVAGAGLVLGHQLAYALGTPHEHARDRLLEATGHGYLTALTQVALLAGALGLLSLFIGRRARRGTHRSFVDDVVWLASMQALAFVAIEVGERLLSGAGLHDLTHGPVLAIGLGVQLAIAIAGAGALRLTERAAEAAETLGRSGLPVARPTLVAASFASWVAPRRPAMAAVASRAPPPLP